MYRPEGWENPYVKCNEVCKKLYNGKPFNAVEMAAFEAGADAMLDALKEPDNSIYVGKKSLENNILLPKILTTGWLVFIPEGEE